MKIWKYLLGVAAVGLAGLTAFAAIRAGGGPPPSPAVVAYTTPTCGCCGKWVTHLRRNGFQVTVHSVGDLDPVRSKLDVPRDLLSCHTAVVDGYIVEGHIPAEDIRRSCSRNGPGGEVLPFRECRSARRAWNTATEGTHMPSFFTERTEPGPCLRLTENTRLRSDRSTSGPIAPGALREPCPYQKLVALEIIEVGRARC